MTFNIIEKRMTHNYHFDTESILNQSVGNWPLIWLWINRHLTTCMSLGVEWKLHLFSLSIITYLRDTIIKMWIETPCGSWFNKHMNNKTPIKYTPNILFTSTWTVDYINKWYKITKNHLHHSFYQPIWIKDSGTLDRNK